MKTRSQWGDEVRALIDVASAAEACVNADLGVEDFHLAIEVLAKAVAKLSEVRAQQRAPQSPAPAAQQPKLTKAERRALKRSRRTTVKWDRAEEIKQWAEYEGLPIVVHNNDKTPHFKILRVNYYPATQRYNDEDARGVAGNGESEFKSYVLAKAEQIRARLERSH